MILWTAGTQGTHMEHWVPAVSEAPTQPFQITGSSNVCGDYACEDTFNTSCNIISASAVRGGRRERAGRNQKKETRAKREQYGPYHRQMAQPLAEDMPLAYADLYGWVR